MTCDLELEIGAGTTPGTYSVTVDSPAGTATGTMRLDAAAILGQRRELAASVLASAVTNRSTFSTLERPVRDVGQTLFGALFADRVYGRYTASVLEASRRGEPLRVVLRLRVPELAAIPWETLFDTDSGEYLCQREPMVRYVESAQPSTPLAADAPLRILGLVSAPKDLPALDTAEERRRLTDALDELCTQGLVELEWARSGTWAALQERLAAGPWHVLHVIGHGGIDAGGGLLALEDESTGNTARVSAGRFARLLHACRPVPRLVVLNSCSSGESAVDDLLSSTAAALVHSGISAAVAMQFAVTDPAALAFSRGFYQALARNTAVDEAVRLGRIAIDGTSEQTLEWVTPVVYLRTDDTHLFSLTPGAAAAASKSMQTAEEDIPAEAAKYGLYVQALAAARREHYGEAITLLDSLITLDPDYRDATERRDGLRRTQKVEADYARARGFEDGGDWDAARRAYEDVIELDRGYRDALSRLDTCRQRQAISSLQDELRMHANERDWRAVLAVSADLEGIDPEAADPDGLATAARAHLAARSSTETGRGGGAATDEGPATRVLPVPPEPREPPPDEGDETGVVPPAGGTGEHEGGDGHGRPRWLWWAAAAVPLVVVLAVLAGLFPGGSDKPKPDGGNTDGGKTDNVTCWDGSSASGRKSCSLPAGAEGMKTVFPSMDENCSPGNGDYVTGKVELFECVYDGYTIRYSRWEKGFDRYGYFNETQQGAKSVKWYVDEQFAGRTWTGLDSRASEPNKFRWVATYRYWPYDVTVKGLDEQGRQAGIERVQARRPEQIGLP